MEHPEGISAISRWLSGATPPEPMIKGICIPEGCQPACDAWESLSPGTWNHRGDARATLRQLSEHGLWWKRQCDRGGSRRSRASCRWIGNPLASRRDALWGGPSTRWYRFAQPPANGSQASGLNVASVQTVARAEGPRLQFGHSRSHLSLADLQKSRRWAYAAELRHMVAMSAELAR